MAVVIQDVTAGSPAQKAGLRAGMELLAVDGHEIRDGLDYEFYTTGAQLSLRVRHGKRERTVVVKKAEYQPLGCVFESYLITAQHRCRNRCTFCFIDQLPQGLRAPLYFKDDDERLGFLFGNYITLTNLSQREIDRIIEMKISPVNISVHTADPALRCEMMGNRFAGEALRYIPQLAQAGIAMNFQLVLVPGVNDGPQLKKTLEWLAGFRPAVRSIAAVPVGLTKHREELPKLAAYDQNGAGKQLAILLEYGEKFKAEDGVRLVYPSDEWFLAAGQPVPPEEFYDGYPQLENGVGMWRLLYDEFTDALQGEWATPAAGTVDIVVGTLAAPLFTQLAAKLHEAFPGVRLVVHAVKNDFFGHSIGVTGLLTGGDIIAQLRHEVEGSTLLLPAVTLRAEGDVLLDDVTPGQIENALGVPVRVVPSGGEFLLEAILESVGEEAGGEAPDDAEAPDKTLSETARLDEMR